MDIHFLTSTPRSGAKLLSQCLSILGIKPLSNELSASADTINQLLLQDLGVSPYSPALPQDWLGSSAALKAGKRIHKLLSAAPSISDSLQEDACRFPLPAYQITINNTLLTKIWHQASNDLGLSSSFTVLLRHPYEVALSLKANHGLDLTQALILWLSHTRAALRSTEEMSAHQEDSEPGTVSSLPASRFPHTALITFDQLLADPVTTLSRVLDSSLPTSRLPLTASRFAQDASRLPLTDLLDHVQPSQKHHHASDFSEPDKKVFEPFARIYNQLRSGQQIETNEEITDILLQALSHDSSCLPLAQNCFSRDSSCFPLTASHLPQEASRIAQPASRLPHKQLTLSITFPSSEKESGYTQTYALLHDQWQKISISVQDISALFQRPIGLIPLNTYGTVYVTGFSLKDRATSKTLWHPSCEALQKYLHLDGTVILVPDVDNLILLVTGKEPFIRIGPLENFSDKPIALEFWIKATRSMNILHSVQKDHIDILQNVIEYDNNDNIIKHGLIGRNEITEHLDSILIGGISECIYYGKNKILLMKGWFLPRSHYDTIEIFDNNNLLIGQPKYNVARKDVYAKHKIFDTLYSGWFFEKFIEHEHEYNLKKIKIVLKKSEQIVKETIIDTKFDTESDHIISKSVQMDSEFTNDIDILNAQHLNLKYYNDCVLHINNKILEQFKNLLSLLNNASLENLYQNFNIEIIDSDDTKHTIQPVLEPSAIIDNTIVDEICNGTDDPFFQKYIKSNYKRINMDAEIIHDLVLPESSILDIGSVPPLLTGLLIRMGHKNITVIDPNALQFGSYFKMNNISAINKSIFDINSNDHKSTYDLVTFCEVIEHLAGDLLQSIETVCNFVKEGGLLYVTTPNLFSISGFIGLGLFHSGLASKYTETVKQQYEMYKEHGYLGHVREYTEKEVIDLFEQHGFQHVHSYYQEDYRTREDNYSKFIYLFENMLPKYRLFGKYVFKKLSSSQK